MISATRKRVLVMTVEMSERDAAHFCEEILALYRRVVRFTDGTMSARAVGKSDVVWKVATALNDAYRGQTGDDWLGGEG